MTKLNFDRLKENVNSLMKERGLKQKDLATAIGMSQPNLNKCLSPNNDSRCFTLEQVCILADYFEVSVDELLDRPRKDRTLSIMDICQALTTLISQNQIVHFDHKVEETIVYGQGDIPLPWPNEEKKIVSQYDAFYFPNYMHIPDYIDTDVDNRYDEVINDINYGGNGMPHNMSINSFLHTYIDTYERYDRGIISEGEYNILKEAYFKVLKQDAQK